MTTANPDSILDTVKKVIGFDPDYTAFDLDFVMYINSALGDLQQMGVSSSTGFTISDNTTLWSQYSTQLSFLGMLKNYICMKTRLAFDPPQTSFGIAAIQKQLEELAWRIEVAAETALPPSDPFAIEAILELAGDESVIFEGGVMPAFFAPKVLVLDYAPVVTPDAQRGNVFYLTLRGPCTLNSPVNGVDGQHVTVGLTNAGNVLAWGNGWNFGDAGVPSVTPGKTDIISAVFRQSLTQWLAGFTPGF